MHTTVITAADRCEARSVFLIALSVMQAREVVFVYLLSTFSNASIGTSVHVLAFSIRTHDVALPFGWRDAWPLK